MSRVDHVQLVNLYLDGQTLASIGAALGVSGERVRQIAVDELGLPARGHGTRQPKPPPKIGQWGRVAQEARNRRVIELYMEGAALTQIERRLGLTRGQVRGILDRCLPGRSRCKRDAA